MAENLPNTSKNVSQNRQKGHFVKNKPTKKNKDPKVCTTCHCNVCEFELLAFHRNMTEFLD
jgi:hypothetical protein